MPLVSAGLGGSSDQTTSAMAEFSVRTVLGDANGLHSIHVGGIAVLVAKAHGAAVNFDIVL